MDLSESALNKIFERLEIEMEKQSEQITRNVFEALNGELNLMQIKQQEQEEKIQELEEKIAVLEDKLKKVDKEKRFNNLIFHRLENANTKEKTHEAILKLEKQITNIEVLQLNFPTDHRMVRACLNIEKIKKSRKNFEPNMKLPTDEQEIKTYLNNLKQNLEKNQELAKTNNVQEYYNFLEDTIRLSLKTNMDTYKKKHKILSDTTKQLIERRAELLRTKNKTKDIKLELQALFKQTNKAIRIDYKQHRQIIIEKNLLKYRSTKRAQKDLTLHKAWIRKLKDGDNNIETRQDIIKCATKFYEELYKKQQWTTIAGAQ
ncbi:hypothetical protein ACJJTC_017524 [Scirpophaga incertulas]